MYVERGGGPATYPAVNAAMAEAYASGLPVLFFPEGTTTDGAYPDGGVMPFRRGLFHSVLNDGVALRVAGLRYSLDGGECWGYGGGGCLLVGGYGVFAASVSVSGAAGGEGGDTVWG